MTYTKQYDWQKIDEKKGWETEGMPDDMHKVKISENEVELQKERWFNFTRNQETSGRWKKHVDQWIERMKQVHQ